MDTSTQAGRCVCELVGLVFAVCRVHGKKPPWARGNEALNKRMLYLAFPGAFAFAAPIKRRREVKRPRPAGSKQRGAVRQHRASV